MKQQIITKEHELFSYFIERLSGVEGCNSRVNSNGDEISDCDCTLKYSVKILRSMENVDIPKTLDYMRQHGGFCDCEVIMNVADLYAFTADTS